MSLPEICIRRPVLAWVMTFIIVTIGIVAFTHLQLRHYPRVEVPTISITTTYSGASPEIIETQVTRPIERALASVEGLDFMRSSSESETSRIDMTFKVDRSLDAAASDVRDRLARIRAKLPEGTQDPVIKKTDSDAVAIIYLALSSATLPPGEVRDYADRFIKDEVEAISGVASVDISGAGWYVMHIWLDPVKMAAYQLTSHEIASALKRQNVHIPAGRLMGDEKELMVTTTARLQTPEEFNEIILLSENNFLIRLKDIGHAEFSPQIDRTRVTFNGKNAVAIGVVKKSIANPLEVGKQLKELLPKIQASLPEGMKIDIAFDKTIFIDQSIDEVFHTVWEATLCVILVVGLFLWSFRASLIPIITIPVSLIASFTLLYFFGFSLNTLSLLALVLAIGLVVDDAIVVLENIHRHIEEGMEPYAAAIKGSKEIIFPVIAMTLTLAAVYFPIALSSGMTGKLFTEFAITLAGAVLISGFVALTLSPMMCSRLLTAHKGEKNLADKWFGALEAQYFNLLKKVLARRLLILVGMVLIGALGGFLTYSMKSELAPPEDQGIIYGRAVVPEGATVNYIGRYTNQMDSILMAIPEVQDQLTMIDGLNVNSMNILKPWHTRKRTSNQILEEIRPLLTNITGITAYASVGRNPLGGSATGEAIQFVLQTTKDLKELLKAALKLEKQLMKNKGFRNLTMDSSDETQEFHVTIDRDKAAILGVEIATIGETLDTLISGRRATDIKKEGQLYEVIAEIDKPFRRTPQDIEGIFVKGIKNQMIPLSNFVDLELSSIPIEIKHFNQLRSLTLNANLAPGYSLGEAVEELRRLAKEVLPESIRTDFAGETRNYLESKNSVALIFGLALIFIYLVMAAQFESWRDPFIIMFSVPLSLTGGLILLWMTGGTLNIFSQIGLVTLIGLITKHGILIVDFANKLQEEGLSIMEAAQKAAMLRLRPILMTTGAMVLGAIPLQFATGAGAEGRTQLGAIIVGGMTFGTLLTLFVIPVVYTYLAKRKEKAAPLEDSFIKGKSLS